MERIRDGFCKFQVPQYRLLNIHKKISKRYLANRTFLKIKIHDTHCIMNFSKEKARDYCDYFIINNCVLTWAQL